MRKKAEDKVFWILKVVLGIFLILVGIVGLFFPILPGIILIIAGLILIGNQAAKRILVRVIGKVRVWFK